MLLRTKRPLGWANICQRNHCYCCCFFFRCKVPECDVGDNNRAIGYDQPWLKYAIPSTSNGFENCLRYAPINVSAPYGHQCSANLFNTSKQIRCTEFVYTTDETNVQTEVRSFFCLGFCFRFDSIRTVKHITIIIVKDLAWAKHLQ